MVSMFIVFIMISSVIGYMWGKDIGDKFEYKDYSFLRKNNQWMLKHDKNELYFDYFPEEVENIDIGTDAVARLRGVIEIDSTYSANDSYAEAIAKAQYDMNEVLWVVSNTYIRAGMTEENEFDLPVINCNDSTAAVPVLYFKKSNITRVTLDECVIAEAKSDVDIIRIKDRLLYGILGII